MIVKMIFVLALGFLMYGLLVSSAHMPFAGAFFLAPLLLCAAMMMFMGHGGNKKEFPTHKH